MLAFTLQFCSELKAGVFLSPKPFHRCFGALFFPAFNHKNGSLTEKLSVV